jgi:hypothetical protein
VSSRKVAAGWGCFIHNEVNAMLDKPEFDCTNLGAFYDCGCAEDEEGEGEGKGDADHTSTRTDAKHDPAQDHLAVEISKEP